MAYSGSRGRRAGAEEEIGPAIVKPMVSCICRRAGSALVSPTSNAVEPGVGSR